MTTSRTQLADVHVTTVGVFVLVGDGSLAVMRRDFWNPDAATPQMRGSTIKGLVADGRAIEWTTVLDGTFLLRFFIGGEETSPTPDQVTGRLRLPTGELYVRSGDHVDPLRVCTLPTGIYDVALEWIVEQEARHYDIAHPELYPLDEGPDGLLTLWRRTSL